jgi:hypothetical protein
MAIEMGGGGLGAAAGISQGLLQGIQTYMQTKNMLEEQAIKKQLANAQSVDAYAKTLDIAGKSTADSQLGNLGLLPKSSEQSGLAQQSPQGFLPKQQASSGMPDNNQNQSSGLAPSGPSQTQTVGQNDSTDIMNLPKWQRELAVRRADPAYKLGLQEKEAQVKNAQNQGFKDLSHEYESDDTIKKARSISPSFQSIMQNVKKEGGDPASDREFLMNLTNIFRNGQIPRGTDPESLKISDPSGYAKYKELASEMVNNRLPYEKKLEMAAAAANHINSFSPDVSLIQKRYQSNAQTMGSKDPTANEPFLATASAAKQFLKDHPDIQPTTLAGDIQKNKGAGGLLSTLASAVTGNTTSANAMPRITDEDRKQFEMYVAKNPNSPKSKQIQKLLNAQR